MGPLLGLQGGKKREREREGRGRGFHMFKLNSSGLTNKYLKHRGTQADIPLAIWQRNEAPDK